ADLTVFELEALCLEDAEELLNDPALLVPFDNAPSVFYTGKTMRCEKPPMQRFDIGASIDLAHVHDGEGQTFRQMAQQFGLRPGQFNDTKTEFELSRASRSLWPRRQLDMAPIHCCHGIAGRIQAGPVGELAIVHAAGDHVEALLSRTSIKSKDVALAVTEHGHRRSAGKQRLGRNHARDPALRFLVRQFAPVMRDRATAFARPYLAAQKPEAGPVVGIHRQHRVEQHDVAIALADFPKRAPALRGGVEVDLTGVLDRQHVAASHHGDRGFAPAFDDPLRCHLVVAEEAIEPHFLRTIPLGEPPQANILARDHASDKRRPPLSRRLSPNRPNVQSIRDNMAALHPTRSTAIEITRIPHPGIPTPTPESIRRTRYVHALARSRGPITTGECN